MSDAQKRNELANALLQISDQISPIFDAADGVRADLERRGWSPTASEAVALQWLQGAIAQIWKSA